MKIVNRNDDDGDFSVFLSSDKNFDDGKMTTTKCFVMFFCLLFFKFRHRTDSFFEDIFFRELK